MVALVESTFVRILQRRIKVILLLLCLYCVSNTEQYVFVWILPKRLVSMYLVQLPLYQREKEIRSAR